MSTHKTTADVIALYTILALVLGGCHGVIDPKAAENLNQSLGHTSVTVFPTLVLDGVERKHDAASAREIADHLTREKLAVISQSDFDIPVTTTWGVNQAKMFRNSLNAFGGYIQSNPIDTDFALVAEYLIGGHGKPVGVHLYLLDATGTPAYAFLTNSHHPAFTAVNPQTLEDCTRIVIDILRADVKQATSPNPTSSSLSSRMKRCDPNSVRSAPCSDMTVEHSLPASPHVDYLEDTSAWRPRGSQCRSLTTTHDGRLPTAHSGG